LLLTEKNEPLYFTVVHGLCSELIFGVAARPTVKVLEKMTITQLTNLLVARGIENVSHRELLLHALDECASTAELQTILEDGADAVYANGMRLRSTTRKSGDCWSWPCLLNPVIRKRRHCTHRDK
jgi:hypothetical protein